MSAYLNESHADVGHRHCARYCWIEVRQQRLQRVLRDRQLLCEHPRCGVSTDGRHSPPPWHSLQERLSASLHAIEQSHVPFARTPE